MKNKIQPYNQQTTILFYISIFEVIHFYKPFKTIKEIKKTYIQT